MSKSAFISSTQVASAVPFDNAASGLASYDVQAAIEELDNEINIQNIVWVKLNPGHKDFSSLAAALASITTATSTNPFTIKIGPGVFTEPQIQMKPYVYVEGSGEQITVLKPSNVNQHFILLVEHCSIKNSLITGVTGSGFFACYMSSATATDQSPASISNCRFGNNDGHLLVSPVNNTNAVFIEDCELGGIYQFNNGFKATTTGSGNGRISFKNCGTSAAMTATYPTYVIYASGVGCEILLHSCSFRTGGLSTGSCIQADNGALLRIVGLTVKGFGKGLWVANTGSGATVFANGITLENNTQDIQIDHAGAFGNIIGIGELSKVTNSSIVLGLLLLDQDTGTTSINSFRTKLDSTATSASTLTLVGGSAMVQNLTGTTAGQIIQLPDATTLQNGHRFEFWNNSTQSVQVKNGSGTNLFVLSQNSISNLVLQSNSTTAGVWLSNQTAVVIAGGITNYNIISSAAFATSSTTDVIITGFTITPQAGTYAVWYSASVVQSTSPVVVNWTIYKAGSAITDSLRSQQTARAVQTMDCSSQTIVQVNGSQAIDVRVATANGTLTVNQRSLILVRLGP